MGSDHHQDKVVRPCVGLISAPLCYLLALFGHCCVLCPATWSWTLCQRKLQGRIQDFGKVGGGGNRVTVE